MPRPTSHEVVGRVVDGVADDPGGVDGLARRRERVRPSGVVGTVEAMAALSCRRCVLAANRPSGVERLRRRCPGRRAARRGEVEVVDREERRASSRPMLATTSALWLRYSTADHTAGAGPRGQHVGVDALDRLLPHRRRAPAACRACRTGRTARRRTGTPRRSPRHGHRHIVPRWPRTGAGVRPGRRGRGRTGAGARGRAGPAPARARSAATAGPPPRPARSPRAAGRPDAPATRAASSCSTLTRPGLTFTRTG